MTFEKSDNNDDDAEQIVTLIPHQPEAQEPPPEGLRVDSREVISAEQILDVLQQVNQKMRTAKRNTHESVTETTARELVMTAYASINKTVLATSLTQLQLKGIRNPIERDIEDEMAETIIREADSINLIHMASNYFTDDFKSEIERQALLKFFNNEIWLLESIDSTSPNYDEKQIKSAIATLRAIKDYYEKHKDIEAGHDSQRQKLDSAHQLPKVRGRPVSRRKGKSPKEVVENEYGWPEKHFED